MERIGFRGIKGEIVTEPDVAHGPAGCAVWLDQSRSPRPGERDRYPK